MKARKRTPRIRPADSLAVARFLAYRRLLLLGVPAGELRKAVGR